MDCRIGIGLALVVAAGAVALSWKLVMRGPDPRSVESKLATSDPLDDAPSVDEHAELVRDAPTIPSASADTPDVARTAAPPARKPETSEEWRRFHLERALAKFEASGRDLRQGSATSVLAQSIATLLDSVGRGRPATGGGPAEKDAYNMHVGDRAYSFRAEEYPEFVRLQALLREAPASGAVRDAELAETIVQRANRALALLPASTTR